MRITCDRCGNDRMLNEAHLKRSDMRIRDIIARMRHDGCGGRAGKGGAAYRQLTANTTELNFKPPR